MFLALGAQDSHLTPTGKIDFHIQHMLRAWKQNVPLASCVKPVPIQVLKHIAFIVATLPPTSNLLQAMADIIIIAFFFLLCTVEYTDISSTDVTLFTLANVQLFIHHCQLNLSTTSNVELLQALSASLTITHQKNGIENEVLCLGYSGNPFLCPALTLACHMLQLHHDNAPPPTPLDRTFTMSLLPSSLLSSIRLSPSLVWIWGFSVLKFLLVCCMLLGQWLSLYTNIIQLLGLGQWHSDEMVQYLHLTADPITKNFAGCMLHADYRLVPSQLVPWR